MSGAQTVHVRGEGGAEFDIEIPKEGSMARERFDEQIRKGQIVIVGTDPRGASSDGVPPVTEGEPPRQGPGSTREAWAAYAKSIGVDATGMNRAEIMAAIANHVNAELGSASTGDGSTNDV